MLRDVVAQGPCKSRLIKNVYSYFFPSEMLKLRETARKTGAFPEQENYKKVWSCHREKAIKGACTVKQAAGG